MAILQVGQVIPKLWANICIGLKYIFSQASKCLQLLIIPNMHRKHNNNYLVIETAGYRNLSNWIVYLLEHLIPQINSVTGYFCKDTGAEWVDGWECCYTLSFCHLKWLDQLIAVIAEIPVISRNIMTFYSQSALPNTVIAEGTWHLWHCAHLLISDLDGSRWYL